MKKSGQTKKQWVFVEVLQNGQTLTSAQKPMHKRGKIDVSAHPGSKIYLPYYDMPYKVRLLSIHKNTVFIQFDHPWEGFVISKGDNFDITKRNFKDLVLPMVVGDLASLHWQDIRIIIRVGPERAQKTESIKRASGYGGSLTSLMIGDRSSGIALGIAFAASLALFGFFSAGLNRNILQKVERFDDLSPEYVLPFVSGNHFENIPEALQENLVVKNYVGSTLAFYRAFINMLAGWEVENPKYLFPTSIAMYQGAQERQKEDIAQLSSRQIDFSQKLLSEQGRGLLVVPAVVGESAQGTARRILDKIAILHKAIAQNLDDKRAIDSEFDHHPAYDFKEYKKVKVNEAAQAALSKIRVWNLPREEEFIYWEGKRLGKVAHRLQKRLKRSAPIYVNPVAFASIPSEATFIPATDFRELNGKLKLLQASEFGKHQDTKVKEPLIGEIEPELIEKVITRNRFELQICFETALRRNTQVEGKMEWQWRIDSRGTIDDLSLLDTSIRDPNMIHCVRQKIASWRFPRPRRGSVEIRYPFEFKPGRG